MAMLKFRAPPLPIAGPDYRQDYFAQLIRAIGLYFNQLDSKTPVQWEQVIADYFNGGLFTGQGYGITMPHIAASDTTDQYATGNDTPTVVAWNTLDSGGGWTLSAPGMATAERAGVYRITFSLQFANTANAIHQATVWLRVNGIDLPNSATFFSMPARKSALVPSYVCGYSEVTFSINVGDEIELYWATEQAATSGGTTGVYLAYEPVQTTPYNHPAVPSVIGSIVFISALPTPNVTGVYASGYVGAVTVSTT